MIGAPSGLREAGHHHLRLLEAMRKEFKVAPKDGSASVSVHVPRPGWFLASLQHIRKVWLSAEQRVKACDELNMAATMFRLASPEEELEIKLFGVQRDPFSIPQNEVRDDEGLIAFCPESSLSGRNCVLTCICAF